MIKKLTRHGNSLAIVLDKPILEQMHISEKTSLDIVFDGKEIRIKPVRDVKKRQLLEESIRKADELYAKTFSDLAK